MVHLNDIFQLINLPIVYRAIRSLLYNVSGDRISPGRRKAKVVSLWPIFKVSFKQQYKYRAFLLDNEHVRFMGYWTLKKLYHDLLSTN